MYDYNYSFTNFLYLCMIQRMNEKTLSDPFVFHTKIFSTQAKTSKDISRSLRVGDLPMKVRILPSLMVLRGLLGKKKILFVVLWTEDRVFRMFHFLILLHFCQN